jgi:antitoxin VapB
MRRLDFRLYIPYIPDMNAAVKTSAFKSGNSVAVRLPKGFGIKPGDELELVQNSLYIRINRVVDPEFERAQVKELVRILNELGPVKNPEPREPIEFPDRPGLY